MGIEGTFLNIIKVIYDKLTANVTSKGKKLKAHPEIINKIRMITLIQHNIGSPSHSSQTRKNKRNSSCKGRSKTVTI